MGSQTSYGGSYGEMSPHRDYFRPPGGTEKNTNLGLVSFQLGPIPTHIEFKKRLYNCRRLDGKCMGTSKRSSLIRRLD